jgi:hypothetical protein
MKKIMVIILKFKYNSLTLLKVRNNLNPEWRERSGDNSYASSLRETERVISSLAAQFFRSKETDQGSLEGNLCGFNCSKAHRKARNE